MKLCKTMGCTNPAAKNKNYCFGCRSKQWRERHPLLYLYLAWRGNAKRRGKFFDVTFDQFQEFCQETGYDKLKGTAADCLSVDRIDPYLGYTKDNIRAITVSDNSKRARGILLEIDNEWKMEENECPF
jgi:hypothetical protein